VLFGAWLLVAVSVLGFHLWSYVRFISAVRRWSADADQPRLSRILQAVQESMGLARTRLTVKNCALVDSPMLVGFFRPTILLPEKSLSADDLECVLRHELTHYRRGDLWVNLLILLVLAMHWFNPLVYLMARIIRAEGEASCDAAAVAGGAADRRRQYGEAIIGFVGAQNSRGPILSTSFFGGSKDMKKRLQSIMDTGRKSKSLSAVFTAAVLSLTVLFGAAWGGTALAAATGAEQTQEYTVV
jgi:beta-lactamase regulating signal transducer with metallopeptidase domain